MPCVDEFDGYLIRCRLQASARFFRAFARTAVAPAGRAVG
jgi:hypothetical protein